LEEVCARLVKEGWMVEVSGMMKDESVVGSPGGGCCRGRVTAEARAAYHQGRMLIARGDFTTSLACLRVAAGLGHAGAMCHLGNLLGVRYQDWSAGLEWIRKAAEMGDSEAMCDLGQSLKEGRGVRRDELGARVWFEKAAREGHPDGMWELGEFFAKRDPAKALVWYRKGAEYGDSASMGCLGALLHSGRGCTMDKTEAFEWFLKAAGEGHVHAMMNVGVMLHDGEGVAMDQPLAFS
jgi:TPR repeat protein